MRPRHLATFERKEGPDDNFGTAAASWEEVAREWISLLPQGVTTQKGEFVDTAQVKGTRRSLVECTWSPTMSEVDTACRMKIAKFAAVNESDPTDDVNFRIFGIEQIVNVDERNRELQMMVTEKV